MIDQVAANQKKKCQNKVSVRKKGHKKDTHFVSWLMAIYR